MERDQTTGHPHQRITLLPEGYEIRELSIPGDHGSSPVPSFETMKPGLAEVLRNDPLVFGMVKSGYFLEDIVVEMARRQAETSDHLLKLHRDGPLPMVITLTPIDIPHRANS